jgi:hypothetical protein
MIGGIPELINPTTGWPVENCCDPREYADQVRAVLNHFDMAVERADHLARLIVKRHSFEAFCAAVRDLVEGRQPRSAASGADVIARFGSAAS